MEFRDWFKKKVESKKDTNDIHKELVFIRKRIGWLIFWVITFGLVLLNATLDLIDSINFA